MLYMSFSLLGYGLYSWQNSYQNSFQQFHNSIPGVQQIVTLFGYKLLYPFVHCLLRFLYSTKLQFRYCSRSSIRQGSLRWCSVSCGSSRYLGDRLQCTSTLLIGSESVLSFALCIVISLQSFVFSFFLSIDRKDHFYIGYEVV